jgi:N-acyl-D-amino-acid deacylase
VVPEVLDLVIRGARVLDGTGAPPIDADVGVRNGRIAAVGRVDGQGGVEVAGAGLTLAPGFIDVHTHDDVAVLETPAMPFKVLQGVTTVVVGNCGFGPVPSGSLGGTRTPGASADLDTYAAFARAIDRDPPSCNVAMLAGHGTIRAQVMGWREARDPSPDEMGRMLEVLDEALAAGAVGVSSGLAYEPGSYAGLDELVAVAARVGERGGLYASHIRDEGDGLLEAVAEAIAVGERAGVPVQISHHKVIGPANWGRVTDSLAMIDAARARGVDVMADQYPYTAGSTMLEQVVRAGGFGGPSVTGRRPFGVLRGDQVRIAAAPHDPAWEGLTLDELARRLGVSVAEAADAVVTGSGRGAFVILESMDERDVETVLRHPTTMVGSDGIAAGGRPHPRLWGTFPRVLGVFSRERGILDLATAVHRMTGMPAARFGLHDRGAIRVGAAADLVLFDGDRIIDRATYEQPAQPPDGIAGVWVNGALTAEDGGMVHHTGARCGAMLRS